MHISLLWLTLNNNNKNTSLPVYCCVATEVVYTEMMTQVLRVFIELCHFSYFLN